MRGFLASLEARAVSRAWAWVALLGTHAALTAHLAARGGSAPDLGLAPLPYAAIGAGVLASHGSVGGPLRSGEILLWLQKPGSAETLLLRWLGEVLALTWVVAALLAGVTALAPGAASAGVLVAALCWGGAAAAMGFAVSATGVHPDGVLSVLWIFVASPFLLLASASGAPAAPAMELLAYPYEHLAELSAGLRAGAPRGIVRPVGRLLLHGALWVLAGLVLGTLRFRSPAPSVSRR